MLLSHFARSPISRRTRRAPLAVLALATMAFLALPAVESANAASCKEGTQKDVTTTIPNPNGPGVATQTKTYQCVGGQYVLVVTTTVSRSELTGSVYDPATGESVSVDGILHFASHYNGDGTVELHANVSDVSATGVSSGLHYSLTGADDVSIPIGPNPPPSSMQATVSLRLAATGACPCGGPPGSVSVDATLKLSFDENGDYAGAVASFSDGELL